MYFLKSINLWGTILINSSITADFEIRKKILNSFKLRNFSKNLISRMHLQIENTNQEMTNFLVNNHC